MPLFRRLATLATAAEAARRYAKSNPEKASRYVDQAASFVDKQTKGKYRTAIDGVAKKAKGVAGIPATPPGSSSYPPANGNGTYGTPGYGPGGYPEGPTQAYGKPGTPPQAH